MEDIAIVIISEIFMVAAPFAELLWENFVIKTLDIFWSWFTETLIASIPDLSEATVKLAFTVINSVAVSLLAAVKKAWQTLRNYLLELMIYFVKNSSNQWVKRSSSTLVKFLELRKPIIVKKEVEEEVNWDELPDDIRTEQIRVGKNKYQVNFAEIRDQEMEVLSMNY